MKEVDWSKAPEDATHFQPAYSYWDNPVFWRIEGGVAREVWVVRSFDEDVSAHFTYGPEGNDCYIPERCIERPTQAWSGEGLPTVGTVCEVRMVGTCYWGKARIKYITKAVCVFAYVFEDDSDELEEYSQFTCNLSFRPIKTQEQIAAEEREKAIHEMWMQVTTDCGDTIGIQKRACADLYDAGYRLTKTEE